MSDAADFDPMRLAHRLVAENSYLTLATADVDGTPWASPVWFANRGFEQFVWVSKPGARHSRNIAENARVSLVIFDSSRTPGEGTAFYASAEAALVDSPGLDDALAVYNGRSVERGLSTWELSDVLEPARHRLYRARILEAFVLDDHDERVKVF